MTRIDRPPGAIRPAIRPAIGLAFVLALGPASVVGLASVLVFRVDAALAAVPSAVPSAAPSAVPSAAPEWPQWRGPDRAGVAPGARLPAALPSELPLVWRAEAGPGYSTPVLSGGRVYFMERAGEDEDEAVRCIDGATGKPIWRAAYAAPFTASPNARRHGTSPKSTTAVTDGRVFAFGITGVLTALDAADGRILWQRDLATEYRSSPLFGVAASPLVEDGVVVLPVGHKEGRGALMAFRVETGETAWKAFEDGPSYGSAIAAELAGVRQAIGFTAKHLVGAALADGTELWSYPFELPWDETIVTPLVWKGNVVFAGRDDGGTRAIRLRREGDGDDRGDRDRQGARLAVEELWVQEDAPVYMSSPVIRGDRLYAIEHGTGRLICLRLDDGSIAWKEGRHGDYASLVLAGDRILILASSGTLSVVDAASDAYREVASWKVSEKPTYAHLVVSGSRLLVRDAESVMAFDLAEDAAPPPAPRSGAADVRFESSPGAIEISVGGRPFATYAYADPATPRPYFAHVRAPSGVKVTRAFPPGPDDPKDHATMHPGIWLAFGDLGGEDFWRLRARVVHDGFVEEPRGGDGRGSFALRNLYLAASGDRVVCTEVARHDVLVRPGGWLLVVSSELSSDADFAFGDQEEMGLGLRLATSIAVKAGRGGRILDAEGRRDEAGIWGKSAAWCDYAGVVEGKPAGATVLPDPANFRPSWYHVRDYGLLVANPFGRKALTGGETSRVVVKAGERFRLRFGVLVHGGEYDPEAAYEDFLKALGEIDHRRADIAPQGSGRIDDQTAPPPLHEGGSAPAS